MENNPTRDQPLNEYWVIYQNSQGIDNRGTLVRLSELVAVFEIYPAAGVLRVSEVLPVFSILLSDKPVYSGRAVITSLVNTGSVCLCEVELEGVWQDAATLASAANLMGQGAVVVLEHSRRRPSTPTAGRLVRTREVTAGESALAFYACQP